MGVIEKMRQSASEMKHIIHTIIIHSDRRLMEECKESDTFRSKLNSNIKYSAQLYYFPIYKGGLFHCRFDYCSACCSGVIIQFRGPAD